CIPAPPADALEEGERIRAFWTVACLQSTLNISSGTDIDTPWPLEMYDYALGALPPAYRGQETLRTFFTEDPPPASPVPTLYAKADVLLQRATPPQLKWSPNLDAQETAAYAVSRAWLDGRIAGPTPARRRKCVSAARALLSCLGDTRVPGLHGPRTPSLARCAPRRARVLMAAVQQARAFNFRSFAAGHGGGSGGAGEGPAARDDHCADVRRGGARLIRE
ncbi:hypothetical protein B0H14DRAFT_2951725, partial [Mycena olivaceomarginata]